MVEKCDFKNCDRVATHVGKVFGRVSGDSTSDAFHNVLVCETHTNHETLWQVDKIGDEKY